MRNSSLKRSDMAHVIKGSHVSTSDWTIPILCVTYTVVATKFEIKGSVRRRTVVRRGVESRYRSVGAFFGDVDCQFQLQWWSLARAAAEEGVHAVRPTQMSAGDSRSARQRSNVDDCRHLSVLSVVVVVAARRCRRPRPCLIARLHDHRTRSVDHMLPDLRS